MVVWKNDDELFALMRETLYSSVIGDILDKMDELKTELAKKTESTKGKIKLKKSMTITDLIKAMEPEIKKALPGYYSHVAEW